MRSTDRLVTLLLVLVTIMLVGMLTASWRVVLYPYLIVIGVIILLGVGSRRGKDAVLLAYGIAVPIIYIALYVWLEAAMADDPGSSRDLVLGLVPATAVYFLAIWPFGLIVAACYAIFHRRIMTDATTGDHS
ncbi:hypothetical protein [Janibacter sp. DB-40]|uniref:hypothetical protein n=1 Tax=Janibacter sp. DB-40 TaxID=3028808 RepID=UPI002406E74A|nr:hypothetical protein [Janibacter sp. DB-40]